MLFLVPAVVLIAIFIIGPITWTIALTFFSEEGVSSDNFVGLDNYATVLSDKDTFNVDGFPKWPPLGTFIHNAIWIAIHLPVSMFFGLFLALILREVRGASIVKSSIFIGMVTPMIVGGVFIQFLLRANAGIVPAFFGLIGVEELSGSWITNRQTVLFGLIFGSVWLWTGFSVIVYSAGLTTIPKEFFEAARIDGTSTLRMFTRITFPLLKPMTLVILTMTLLWELKIFDIVFIATNVVGGPAIGLGSGAADVLALQSYRYAFVNGDFALGSTVATLLTFLTLFAAVLMVRYMVKR